MSAVAMTKCCALGQTCAALQVALSTFRFKSANALLFFQCLVCVVSVKLCQGAGVVKGVEPFSFRVTRVWFPVNLIFVGEPCAARLSAHLVSMWVRIQYPWWCALSIHVGVH
jgi:hypothetical protein